MEEKQIVVLDQTYKWKLDDGHIIESSHPPLRKIKFEHRETEIIVSPFKTTSEIDGIGIKKIVEQNNFSNQHLHTIGKQLDRIENFTQNGFTSLSITISKKDLKPPLFKNFEIPKTPSFEFAKALEERKRLLKGKAVLIPKKPIVLDTPLIQNLSVKDTPDRTEASNQINLLDKSDTESLPELNRITWKDPQKLYYSCATPPDILTEETFSKVQNKYSSDAIYEWNIDGVSEQNLINILTQMVMLANTYKTIPDTSDHSVAYLLIAGFTGQLKGWWDNYLNEEQRSQILNAYKLDLFGQNILDDDDQPIQDAVNTLIFSISQHFLGDSSHILDKN